MHSVEYELSGTLLRRHTFLTFLFATLPFRLLSFQFLAGDRRRHCAALKGSPVHRGKSRFYYRQALGDSKGSSTLFIA